MSARDVSHPLILPLALQLPSLTLTSTSFIGLFISSNRAWIDNNYLFQIFAAFWNSRNVTDIDYNENSLQKDTNISVFFPYTWSYIMRPYVEPILIILIKLIIVLLTWQELRKAHLFSATIHPLLRCVRVCGGRKYKSIDEYKDISPHNILKILTRAQKLTFVID